MYLLLYVLSDFSNSLIYCFEPLFLRNYFLGVVKLSERLPWIGAHDPDFIPLVELQSQAPRLVKAYVFFDDSVS
jgi:hypothetical protein